MSHWDNDIWTIEGPEVCYRLGGVGIPCPTRATIVRYAGGGLWVHSPVPWIQKLSDELAQIGHVEAIVAPNSYHHIHAAEWAARYPNATLLSTPDLISLLAAVKPIPLTEVSGQAWADHINCQLVDLGSFQEAMFFHRQSRTLIVTDLMQNFEASRVKNVFTRWLLKAGGATGPSGQPSLELRLATRKHREHLRQAIAKAREWDPVQIILSHGLPYRSKAIFELNRAFAWLGV